MYISKIINGLGFKAGKAHLYSDFDGTYFPAKHSSLYNSKECMHLTEYAEKMCDFFEKTEEDLFFNITTGRTFGEYEVVSELIKSKGFKLPLPKTFIAKNGSNKYLKMGNDKDFYQGGKFPFDYNHADKSKEGRFLKSHNWNGEKIKEFITSLAEELNINIIEADSENSVRDYGERSLFSEGKLNRDDWKKLPQQNGKFLVHEKPILDYTIGSRKDGNLKFHFIFSPDFGPCVEKNNIYDEFISRIKEFFSQNKTKYNMHWEPAGRRNYYRNSCTITPDMDGEQLTKLYDTKLAVQKAIEEDDVVIVAGDGINDFEMLNPLEYLEKEFLQECENKSSNKVFYRSEMYKRLNDLAKVLNENYDSPYIKSLAEEFKSNGLIEKILSLPFYGIVVKSDKSDLADLVKAFEKTGKIIEVESGNIDEGVKIAVKNHAEKNPKFKDKMSDKFKTAVNVETKPKEIKPEPKTETNIVTNSTQTTNNSLSKNKKIMIGSAIFAAIALGFAYCYRFYKSREEKECKS